MNFKRLASLLVVSTFFLAGASPAFARYGRGGGEMKSTLANGAGQTDANYYGGIMSFNQNAANLIRNSGVNTITELRATDGDLDPLGIGIGLAYGKDRKYAIGGGYLTSTADQSIDYLTLGMAANLGNAVAIGVQGLYNIDGSSFDGNLGLLFNPMGAIRVGASVYSFNAGFDALGFGIGYDLSRNFTLSTDVTGDDDFDNLVLTPGIRFSDGPFSAAVGYALGLGDPQELPGPNSAANIAQPTATDEFFASMGVWFKEKVNLNLSYQYGAKYVVGLTFKF